MIMLFLLSPCALAAECLMASRGVTSQGSSGLMVPLGIENYVPLATALMYYNWIAIMILFIFAGISSRRNMRFLVVLIPIFAAVFGYIGWLNLGANHTKLWSLIIVTAVLAIMIYMKDTNRESNGSGGPGGTLLNICLFMIFLQAAIGFGNSTEIWENNAAASTGEYMNVDLTSEVASMNEQGGFGDSLDAAVLFNMGMACLKTILAILGSIVMFSAVLYIAYPWLFGVPIVAALVGIVQVMIWILYGFTLFQWIFKPGGDGAVI